MLRRVFEKPEQACPPKPEAEVETGYEVWYVRGEPRPEVGTKPSIGNRDVLYKSGVYARKALCLPVGRQVLPREVSHVHRLWVVLRGE